MSGKAGAHAPWESLTAQRDSQGLSKSELARRAKINLSHLGALESGRVSPQAATVKQLADALGVPVGAIPPPGNTSWISDTVKELVKSELARAGLGEMSKELIDARSEAEVNLQRVGVNLTQRAFLREVVRVRNLEATTEDIIHMVGVLEDAVHFLKKSLVERGVDYANV